MNLKNITKAELFNEINDLKRRIAEEVENNQTLRNRIDSEYKNRLSLQEEVEGLKLELTEKNIEAVAILKQCQYNIRTMALDALTHRHKKNMSIQYNDRINEEIARRMEKLVYEKTMPF